jgi:glycosyltransferase involved in cell wall biosynthesis
LIYDSHEWFTEAEGLTGRHGVRRFWLSIESWILPKLKFAITVNDSIAAAYKELYGVDMRVMRNVPLRKQNTPQRDRSKWPFPAEHQWIILQGAYIDPDRGAEEAVDAMKYLENVHLIIAGSGRALEMLKQSADKKKVSFVSKLPYEELLQLTACCDLGLSLDKPIHKNYLYSLPNKIFDYASVQVPVLVSPLPEIQKLLQQYPMGDFIQTWDPHALAKDFKNAITSERYEEWKENGMRLNQEVCWENESLFLKDWIRNF